MLNGLRTNGGVLPPAKNVKRYHRRCEKRSAKISEICAFFYCFLGNPKISEKNVPKCRNTWRKVPVEAPPIGTQVYKGL